MWEAWSRVSGWLTNHEALAVWLEGIALVLILFLDWTELRNQHQERKEQHDETAAQMDIWRKQIHSQSVREIWKALRNFEYFVVHSGMVAPGRQFIDEKVHADSIHGFAVCKPYFDLQEAYYLSNLVSARLFDYMKQRMTEADGLQRVPDATLLQKKLQEFHKNWDVYEMAAKIRELS